MYALTATTGELLWKYDTANDGPSNEFHTEPVATPQMVIIGSDLREPDAAGHVYGFEPETGVRKWKFDLPVGVAGTILQHGSSIYAMSFYESLIGLNIADGKLITPPEDPSSNASFLFPSSPAISNDTIFFAKRDGWIRAIHAVTHSEIWTHKFSEQITTDLAIQGDLLFAATAGKKVYALEAETGKLTGSFSTPGTARWKLLLNGANLLFLEWDDANIPVLRCVNAVSGKEVWQQPSPPGSYWDTFRPLIWKNAVVVGSAAGHVSAFDIADGRLVWSLTVPGHVRMLGASEDLIYAGCTNGALFALMPF